MAQGPACFQPNQNQDSHAGSKRHRNHHAPSFRGRPAPMAVAMLLSIALLGFTAQPHVCLTTEIAASPPTMIAGKVLSISAAAAALSAVKIVGTGEVQLIERLGKYNRRLEPGLHFIIPLIERTSYEATQREQVLDIPPQKAITRDNAPLTADAVVYWKIQDPVLSRYAVADLMGAIQNLVLTQIRSEIGKLTLDETFSAREKMNAVLLEAANSPASDWGVEVTRVEVRDIIPSADITNAMEMQMAAERKKRANVLESEGRRESQVNDARGAADAKVLAAEAEATRIETVAKAEAASLATLADAFGGDQEKAMQVQLLYKYWLTQAALANSENTKVDGAASALKPTSRLCCVAACAVASTAPSSICYPMLNSEQRAFTRVPVVLCPNPAGAFLSKQGDRAGERRELARDDLS